MLHFDTTAAVPEETADDDWFGEGNAFESGEELAAALLAIAEPEALSPADPASAAVEASSRAAVRDSFLLDADDVVFESATPTPRPQLPAEPKTPARGWSVRVRGAVPLPPRTPGHSGWSIRNSVQVLQHAEGVLASLRKEAVEAALLAAARAMHPD